MSRYRIVYDDPAEPDAPAKVVVPDDRWIAQQIAKGMTEEQAIEILVIKDVPARVWARRGANRSLMTICTVDQLPSSHRMRDAWRLTA